LACGDIETVWACNEAALKAAWFQKVAGASAFNALRSSEAIHQTMVAYNAIPGASTLLIPPRCRRHSDATGNYLFTGIS